MTDLRLNIYQNKPGSRIYIINGAPEKISYEYNDQTEFEIWEYNNRHYIFTNNYGDYELYDPNNN